MQKARLHDMPNWRDILVWLKLAYWQPVSKLNQRLK